MHIFWTISRNWRLKWWWYSKLKHLVLKVKKCSWFRVASCQCVSYQVNLFRKAKLMLFIWSRCTLYHLLLYLCMCILTVLVDLVLFNFKNLSTLFWYSKQVHFRLFLVILTIAPYTHLGDINITGCRKKVKFCGIFWDKFVGKVAEFAGNLGSLGQILLKNDW